MALSGVTQHGLFEAVKFILRGALGHAFFPSPPELRMQCDRAMEWHERERERIRHREKIARDREPDVREPPADEKARVAKLLAGFYAGYEKDKVAETSILDPELVAKVADNPKALARQRMGAKP